MGHSPIRANREIQPEGQMPMPEKTLTVAQLLKAQGYATAQRLRRPPARDRQMSRSRRAQAQVRQGKR